MFQSHNSVNDCNVYGQQIPHEDLPRPNMSGVDLSQRTKSSVDLQLPTKLGANLPQPTKFGADGGHEDGKNQRAQTIKKNSFILFSKAFPIDCLLFYYLKNAFMFNM